jgi:hypothetical protein
MFDESIVVRFNADVNLKRRCTMERQCINCPLKKVIWDENLDREHPGYQIYRLCLTFPELLRLHVEREVGLDADCFKPPDFNPETAQQFGSVTRQEEQLAKEEVKETSSNLIAGVRKWLKERC